MVLGGPAGREPGPHRPHEFGGKAGVFSHPGGHRGEGDRDRLPLRQRDGVRDLPGAHRGGPHPGRRDHPGVGPGPGAPHQKNL